MQDNLLQCVAAHAESQPDAVFAHLLKRAQWSQITWAELASESAAYAALYARHGIAKGDVVLVILEHGRDLFPAFLGAMLASCIPSFLPFPSRKQEPRRYWQAHRPLFERIGAGGIVTWTENVDPLTAEIGGRLACLTPGDVQPGPSFPSPGELADIDPDSIAFLQHSSGTTGTKKGVALTHRVVMDQLRSVHRAAGFVPGDRIATWLPVYHDMGLVGCFLLPVAAGIPIAALDPFEWVARPHLILDAIQLHRCTHTWWPNFAFQHVSRTVEPEDRWDLSGMKAFFNTSEPAKPKAFAHFLETFAASGVRREHFQGSYGMAEVVFLMTMTRIGSVLPSCVVDADRLAREGVAVSPTSDAAAVELLSVGRPLDGIEYDIVDDTGSPLPDGHVGEVLTRSRFLFSGYFRNPEETAKKLRNGAYSTGDLAFRMDGELYIVGRKDDRIIVCGKNFFAHDIEYVVSGIPGVKGGRVVAIGAYSEELGSEDVVVIAETDLPPPERAPLAEKARLELIEQLALSPRVVHVVAPGWIMKTTSGKMSRYANLEKYRKEARAGMDGAGGHG